MELDVDVIKTEFEKFWKIQRRKIDKAMCLSIYREVTSPGGKESKVVHDGEQMTVHTQGTPSEIYEGCEAYLWVNRDEPDKFIIHPSRFLKKGRWMDQEDNIVAMNLHRAQDALSKAQSANSKSLVERSLEQQSKDRPFSAANFREK
jgi:hypothetical protein